MSFPLFVSCFIVMTFFLTAPSPLRAIPIPGAPYGARAGDGLGNPIVSTFTNQTQQSGGANDQTSYTASSTQVYGTGMTFGEVVDTGFGGFGGNANFNNKLTFETDYKVTYMDSTAVSSQLVTTASVMLQDVDNTVVGSNGPVRKNCHGPLPKQRPRIFFWTNSSGVSCFRTPTDRYRRHRPFHLQT